MIEALRYITTVISQRNAALAQLWRRPTAPLRAPVALIFVTEATGPEQCSGAGGYRLAQRAAHLGLNRLRMARATAHDLREENNFTH
ncbi:unnamed protein product [Arctia plantaginis]|uniref:Uncharacterized protein n=1 Tax=Arctia plantaginis TaxID=874455 RepID=A0A8S0Z426_ARCPL|nr:unnamed protein product [Arctia plantaginis]